MGPSARTLEKTRKGKVRPVDLYTLLKIIARRWYAAVPVLSLVLLIGPGLVGSADPEYRASGSVVLLRYDPRTAGAPEDEESPPRNPYADFNGSVVVTAAVLENIGSGDVIRQRVVDGGASADFTIDQAEDAPILEIEATAATAAQAIATVAAVTTALESELAARQEHFDVPVEDRIVLEVVLVPERAARLETARNRALTIVIALGLAGVIAASVLAESFAQGRARNRRAAVERAETDRAAMIGHAPSGLTDATPPADQPRLPDQLAIGGSNGEPTTPAEQPRR